MIAARTADKLAETKWECEQYTSDVHMVIADVSKEDDCRVIVNKAVDEFGAIDILILNAAITPTPRFFTDTVSDHHKGLVVFIGLQLNANEAYAYLIDLHLGIQNH